MDVDKKCPMCAEDVRAEALVCRFCGYDFRTPGRLAAVQRAQAEARQAFVARDARRVQRLKRWTLTSLVVCTVGGHLWALVVGADGAGWAMALIANAFLTLPVALTLAGLVLFGD